MFPPNSWLLQGRKYIGFFAKLEWKTLWRNCSEKREKAQAAGCRVVGSTYLVLKILPHAMSVQARDRADVLGTAALDEKGVGFYGYAFYDRIQRLAEGRRLSPTLLGHVLAHEIGHLLYDRFHARDVAPQQARTLFDVALGEFLFLAEPAKTVPNNHGGIIPLRRCGRHAG